MIKGLDVFRRHFEHYTDRYVLIGGVAVTLAMEKAGLDFRAAKDKTGNLTTSTKCHLLTVEV